MKKMIQCCLLFSATLCFSAQKSNELTPDAALSRLIQGNTRFISGNAVHKNLTAEDLAALKKGQQPFAIVVGCSDSRVPPELIFDQGVGDIFVVRVAGNVIGPIELDTIEYGVDILNCPLVIVLGHESCGAVKSALQSQDKDPELKNIYPLISPALKTCKTDKADPLTTAVKCNVNEGVKNLKANPIISKHIADRNLKVVGGYYDFDQGKVTILSP